MPRRRKKNEFHSGWMLSVVFNSLLILMPVIAARTITAAYAGAGFAETSNVDAIAKTQARINAALADLAPRSADDQFKQWNERITDALAARDTSMLRGLLLAAPDLLGRERGAQIELRATAEAQGTRDERLIRAALTVLPMELAAEIEEVASPTRNLAVASPPSAPGQTGEPGNPGVMSAADRLSARPDPDRRFQMLGNFSDLAVLSETWLTTDRSDNLVIKLTGFGLVEDRAAGASGDAIARAASILKSAARSDRLQEEFRAFVEARADLALPDEALRPALENAFNDFVTSGVRGDRVRDAFVSAVNPDGAAALERELAQIDKIATLTSPAATLAIIQKVRTGTDLRRARLLAEAGGDRLIVLVRYGGDNVLSVADAGIRWTPNMALELMSLTAAGMVLFWVMLSALHFYMTNPGRKPTKVQPI